MEEAAAAAVINRYLISLITPKDSCYSESSDFSEIKLIQCSRNPMRNSEIILLQFLFSFHLARLFVILGVSFNYIFLHSSIKLNIRRM